jgi:hypothetical protein
VAAEEAAVQVEDEGFAPVVDDSPAGDPEVAAVLDADPGADRAEHDARRDAEGDPIAGRDAAHGDDGVFGDDESFGIDPGADEGRHHADLSGQHHVEPHGPDPFDPDSFDPALRHSGQHPAHRLDEHVDARGAVAPASGRDDVGPEGRLP